MRARRSTNRGHERDHGKRQERRPVRVLRPLDPRQLDELALAYVARFATSSGKLAAYLKRKLMERGWAGDATDDDGVPLHPDMVSAGDAIDTAVRRMVDLAYLDDAHFALSRGEALTRRGLGLRRIDQQLRADGLAETDRNPALAAASEPDAARDAALTLARKRRLGPYARAAVTDPAARQKAIAVFLRAGHSMTLAREILAMEPGEGE